MLVIYDYMCGPEDSAVRNLEAFDTSGRKLWTAENPGKDAGNAYVNFVADAPLTAWNFSCFLCTIDLATGRLLKAEFTK